jgi:hypothetical protein
MASRDTTRPDRPILAGGEALRRDAERASGGGPKFHPRSFEEARERLNPQVDALRQAVAQTPAALRGARVIFEATVLPNYLANSYFPAELFREADLVPVGTRAATGPYQTRTRIEEDQPTKSYLLAGDEQSIARVSELLTVGAVRGTAGTARDRLRQFDVVRLPDVDEVLRARPDEPTEALLTWEAVLHPTVDASGGVTAAERQEVLAKWAAWITQLGGEIAVDYQRLVRGMTFMPVRLPAGAAEQATRFNPLRALRPMPRVRPSPVGPLRVVATGRQLPAPPPGQRPQSDLRVAVFDGGVSPGIPHLDPFVDAIDVTPEPEDPDSVAHGTMVTGAALYGSLLGTAPLGTPAAGIDHFRVVPAPSPPPWDVDLYWILDRIVEQVRARGYPIVNLSLGPDLAVDDQSEPHRWTAELDELTDELGVLFITAVGNNGELDAPTGLNRVQVPSDMVNALSVGACDRLAPAADWERAVYSAVGPGRSGARIKPCGVAFGGDQTNPFSGIAPGAQVGESCGTSFAAPLATHGILGLAARLGPQLTSPDLLRAFALHFAEPPNSQPIDEVGFGRLLERYDERWNCQANEATVLYRDTIERDQVISLPFPLVGDVVAGRTVELRWTLAFTAPTDPTDAVDYTQAGLEVTFRPHARRFSFRDPVTNRSVELDIQDDRQDALDRLSAGALISALPATRSTDRHRNEALQREEGKWETALHYSKRMRASSLFDPQVTVNYLAREDGRLATAPALPFTMLVSMRAPQGVELYDAIRQRYQVLVPLVARLPLQVRT